MATLFTDMAVKNWPKTDKRQEIADSKEKGLYLFVFPSGERSFVHRYRAGAKLKKITLGLYPTVSLGDAREAVQRANKLRLNPDIAARVDPKEHRKEQLRKQAQEANKEQRLFLPVVERYLKEHASKRRSESEKSRLLGFDKNKKIRPDSPLSLWGKKSIDRPVMEWRGDIRANGKKMVEAGTGYLANRTFAELRKLFNWMAAEDILVPSPMVGMKPPFEGEESRNRVLLSETEQGTFGDELRWLWQASDREKYPFGPYIKLLILTGARSREEVARMTWDQIDLDARTWTIPADRAKNGKEHIVPLSDQAMAVLESLPTRAGLLFTTTGSTDNPTPISGLSKLKTRLDKAMQEIALLERGEPVEIELWRYHDCRRTAATGMQLLGLPIATIEKALNHKSGVHKGLVSVYQVSKYLKEVRPAFQAWADGVTRVLDGKMLEVPEKTVEAPEPPTASNVVQMRATA